MRLTVNCMRICGKQRALTNRTPLSESIAPHFLSQSHVISELNELKGLSVQPCVSSISLGSATPFHLLPNCLDPALCCAMCAMIYTCANCAMIYCCANCAMICCCAMIYCCANCAMIYCCANCAMIYCCANCAMICCCARRSPHRPLHFATSNRRA